MAVATQTRRDARRAALLASPLFEAMRPEELDQILQFSSERGARRGETIFEQGDEGSSMMAVLQGRVRATVTSPEGREVTLNEIGAGEVVGEIALLDGKPRSATVRAVEDTRLLVVERRNFLPFLRRNEDLYLRMLGVLCDKIRRTSLALEELALLELPARLARLLLRLAQDFGRPDREGIRVDFKLVHGDLANRVASRRETVAKQMKAWERDGIIRQQRVGYYVVLRPEELRSLANPEEGESCARPGGQRRTAELG